jgi:uncharacterized RmlC-like cupin family protein
MLAAIQKCPSGRFACSAAAFLAAFVLLGPGGFNYIPAHTPHQAWCSDDALVFITVDAAWDVNWVKGPPNRSDLGQRPPTN